MSCISDQEWAELEVMLFKVNSIIKTHASMAWYEYNRLNECRSALVGLLGYDPMDLL